MYSPCSVGVPPNEPTALLPVLRQILTALGGAAYSAPCGSGVGGDRRDMAALIPVLSGIASAIAAAGGGKDEQELSITPTGLAIAGGNELSWIDLFAALLPTMQVEGVEVQDAFGVPQYYGLPL